MILRYEMHYTNNAFLWREELFGKLSSPAVRPLALAMGSVNLNSVTAEDVLKTKYTE